ncbi:MAG: pyrroline-5-carboxylate reductase [Hyphomicrobiaceae bacterium]|jgi:pyrroline-5-carboxylate reductase
MPSKTLPANAGAKKKVAAKKPAAAPKASAVSKPGAAAGTKTKRKFDYEIGFIGGGNMAEAMIRGLVGAGNGPGSIAVAEPVATRRAYLRKVYRIAVLADGAALAASARIVVLAVKPQILPEVLQSIAEVVTNKNLILSIAAGVRLGRMEKALGEGIRVVRCMPNTPCLVGRGAAVLCRGKYAKARDISRARGILSPVAAVYVTDKESTLDPVTGLSGSGPAYVYRFAEALVRGGRKAGLNEELARRLTYQTLLGAAEMLIQTGQTPEDLRKAVSSPGGTTVAGLAALEEGGFVDTVVDAVVKATKRSKELARS